MVRDESMHVNFQLRVEVEMAGGSQERPIPRVVEGDQFREEERWR